MKKLIILACLALSATTVSAQAPAPVPEPAPAPASDVAALRKTCAEAMNADPAFAKSIIATADKQIDQKTIDAHTQANAFIAKNERHVLLAYGAMWIIAALFVAFLWLRQQKLRAEITQLRKDLDAAGKEP
jgi:hypothetical protein